MCIQDDPFLQGNDKKEEKLLDYIPQKKHCSDCVFFHL